MNAESPDAQILAPFVAQMVETSDALSVEADPRARLRLIVRRAREVTGARWGALSVFDAEGHVEQFVFDGMDERMAQALGGLPTGRGLLGLLARHRDVLRLDDLREHESFTGWPEGHPEMVAFIGTPLRAAGATIGSLYLTREDGEPPFNEHDEMAATILGLQASAVVAMSLAQERQQRVGLLEERQAIAHDLHDGTIQTLYAIGLRMSARRDSGTIPEHARQELSAEIEMLNNVIAEIREYISALEQPVAAGRPDLPSDLAHIVQMTVPREVDTMVNIMASSLQEISSRESEDLLYIAREAISNAVRHGHPSKVAIDLRETPAELALTVQDNGEGFDQANARVGLGTVTMRTRAERIGGRLTVLSIPGMGTTVRVTRPRRPPAADDELDLE